METQRDVERRGRSLRRRDHSRKKTRGQSASSRRSRSSRHSESGHKSRSRRTSHSHHRSKSRRRREMERGSESRTSLPLQLKVAPLSPRSHEPVCTTGCVNMADAIPQAPRNEEPAYVGGCVKYDSVLDAVLHFIWARFEKAVDDDKTHMEGYEIHTGVTGEDCVRTRNPRKQQQQQERRKRRVREPSLFVTVSGPDLDG